MTDTYIGTADYVTRLERAFAKKMGRKHAVAMNSGTSTLHASLLALGVGQGDEVIVPALGPIMTAAAVILTGAKPVFCDVEGLTYVLDNRACLWDLINERTKAVISVSLYGLPCRLDEIQAICQDYGLHHIEDNAQCFLSTFGGKLVGSYSDVASYSFESSKHISCGEGGIITCDNDELATRIRKLANHGYAALGADGGSLGRVNIQDPAYKRHDTIGYNYRLAEPLAKIALEQVERLEHIVEGRIQNAETLREIIRQYKFFTPQVIPSDRTHSYYTLGTLYHPDISGVSWKEFYNRFTAMGGEGFYGGWAVVYTEPAYPWIVTQRCTCAEDLQPNLMQFPTNQKWGEADNQAMILDKLCKEIKG